MSDCTNTACHRHFGPDESAAAEEWRGGPDAPVAFSNFSPTCPEYKPPPNVALDGNADQEDQKAGAAGC